MSVGNTVLRFYYFLPFGFEMENVDALNRYSAAQYGYNQSFPMAVGANMKYTEIGFDGFEDYDFVGCNKNTHFTFDKTQSGVSIGTKSHSGRKSLKVEANTKATITKKLTCTPLSVPITEKEEDEKEGGN